MSDFWIGVFTGLSAWNFVSAAVGVACYGETFKADAKYVMTCMLLSVLGMLLAVLTYTGLIL